jgi:hypothetical protein
MRSICVAALLGSAAALQGGAPPVISLRLSGDDVSNSAADSCAVYSRDAATTGPTAACPDPVCDAHDHHEGSLTCSISVTLINEDGSTSGGATQHADGATADRKLRSTWLYHYDAADSSGNAAEQVTFALTVYDHESPVLIKPLEFAGAVVTTNTTYRAESCNMHGEDTDPFGTDPCTWVVPNTAAATDNYDSPDVMRTRVLVSSTAPKKKVSTGLKPQSPDHPTCKAHLGTVHAFCGSVDVKEWGIGTEGETKAIANCNHAANTGDAAWTRCANDLFIDTKLTGLWLLRWEVCDRAGQFGVGGADNCVSEETRVTVVDSLKPTIEVMQADKFTEAPLECGVDVYHEFGARCKDQRDSWSGAAWHFDSNVDGLVDPQAVPVAIAADPALSTPVVLKEGSFFVDYECTDEAHNAADLQTREVTVHDTRPPNVYLTLGISLVQHSAGATQHDNPGNPFEDEHAQIDWDKVHDAAMCTDECSPTTIHRTLHYGPNCSDALIGTSGELSSANFPEYKPGLYSVQYLCSDQAQGANGPHSAKVCLTIDNVDQSKPTITLLGNSTQVLEATLTGQYVDDGATCSDQVDGIISQNIEVSGDIVNLAKVGTYTVNYDCADAAGNDADVMKRTVMVQQTTCPTCKIIGSVTLDHEASFAYTDEGATCSDVIVGDKVVMAPTTITKQGYPETNLNNVHYDSVGVYEVTYRAHNAVGLANDDPRCSPPHSYVRTVEIKDTLAPVIRLSYAGKRVAWSHDQGLSTTTGDQTAGVKNPFVDGNHVPPLMSHGYLADTNPDVMPLQLCHGDCDSDGHCAAGLTCHQNSGKSEIPGCTGISKEGMDYCVGTALMAEEGQTTGASRSWFTGAAAAGAAGLALLVASRRKQQAADSAQPTV